MLALVHSCSPVASLHMYRSVGRPLWQDGGLGVTQERQERLVLPRCRPVTDTHTWDHCISEEVSCLRARTTTGVTPHHKGSSLQSTQGLQLL